MALCSTKVTHGLSRDRPRFVAMRGRKFNPLSHSMASISSYRTCFHWWGFLKMTISLYLRTVRGVHSISVRTNTLTSWGAVTYSLYRRTSFSTSVIKYRVSPQCADGRAQFVWRLSEEQSFISGQGYTSCPALWPTQLHGNEGAFLPVIKRPGREVDHSHQSGAEVKNKWICTSTPTIRA